MISNFTNRNSESASQVVGFGTILQVGISDLQNDAPTVPSAKTTPTFSHYTMNNHKNTMNNNSNDNHHSYHDITSAAVKRTPARKHLPPGTMSSLYKLAARNLREHHGVPSMTALKLEKTVALLRLAPRRVVVQRLAPRRLLKGDSPPLVSAGEGSGKGEEEPCGTETCELMETSDDSRTNNSSSSGAEEKGVSDDSDSMNDKINNSINNNGGDTKDDVEVLEANGKGKARRPIHAALVAGGIDLHPSETRPLLRALGVRAHRLVRFGLVKRGAVCTMPRRRGGGPGQRQHLRAGGPRQGHLSRPHGALQGSTHGHGGWPMHGPPRPFHGDGHHTMHLGEEIE